MPTGATVGNFNILGRVFQSSKIFLNIGNAVEIVGSVNTGKRENGKTEKAVESRERRGDCLNHGLRGLHGSVLGTGWRGDILWRGENFC